MTKAEFSAQTGIVFKQGTVIHFRGRYGSKTQTVYSADSQTTLVMYFGKFWHYDTLMDAYKAGDLTIN